MDKIEKFIIWFIFVTCLKISKSSAFQINEDLDFSSNDTGLGILSFNETSFINTFQEDSANNLIVSTEIPRHHKAKRSILVYKQKTLKIQVPDAPLYISSGRDDGGGESGMPISLMLKSPDHSLKSLPYLINALKTSSQHWESGGNRSEPNGMHLRALDPSVTGNKSNTGGPVFERMVLGAPSNLLNILHMHNREAYPELSNGTTQSSVMTTPVTTDGKNLRESDPPAKMKYEGESYHHSPKRQYEGRFSNYQNEHPYKPDHHQFEPSPGRRYAMYPHDGRNWNVSPENAQNQQSIAPRMASENAPGVEINMNQWHGGGPKDFDTVKKETTNMLTKRLMDNKGLVPLKQSLEKRDESTNTVPGALEEPKLNPMQDLTDGAMNFQSIKFVKNSWVLPPPVNKRNPQANSGNKDLKSIVYNDLHAPPSRSLNSGYEENPINSRSQSIKEEKSIGDPDINHEKPGDKYMLSGTEEPEMSFDDKGNLLFLKKQTLEILVPKYLMNYTQEGTTTPHYELVQRNSENDHINPPGNPPNKRAPPRVNTRYITPNDRDKEYYLERYMNKRRSNRDIKATFWHNRGLEDQLIPKTSTEKQL